MIQTFYENRRRFGLQNLDPTGLANAGLIGKYKMNTKHSLRKRSRSLLISAFFFYSVPFVFDGSASASDGAKEHCVSVRNDDTVKKIPKELLNDARKLYGSDDHWLMVSTVYRCMNGRVRLCNAGANIICAKPNRRRGSPEISAFCRENPGEDVPMAVTGHDALYGWKCVGSKPVINFTAELDSRGFIENVWTPID